MKLTSALFFCIGSAFPLMGSSTVADQDEVVTLLELIDTTKKNLEDQQKLLKLVLDFKKTKDAFITDPTSAKIATALVRNAMKVKIEIDKNQWLYLFSNDFLAEIQFFVQVGEQQGLKDKV